LWKNALKSLLLVASKSEIYKLRFEIMSYPIQAYSKVLVVVKQTAYQMYQQLKARGQAPLALRWNKLQVHDAIHRNCVEV
jgi:hypothetical protein